MERCSGAKAFARSTAAARSSARHKNAPASSAGPSWACRPSDFSWLATADSTAASIAASIGDQADDAVRPVLGLREEVGRDPVRVGSGVGEDEDFARPGQQVDAHLAEHLALGFDHVGVPRAENFGRRRDGRRAEGERRDRLRAAGLVHLGRPRELERAEQGGGDAARRIRRRGDDDLGHARRRRQRTRHDRRGNQRRGAARHVDAHPGEGGKAFAHLHALPVVHGPVVPQAFQGEGAHVLVRLGQRPLDARLRRAGRRGELRRGNAQSARRQARAAETLGQCEDGLVAAGAHLGNDVRHGLLDLGGGRGAAVQGGELFGEIGVLVAKGPHRRPNWHRAPGEVQRGGGFLAPAGRQGGRAGIQALPSEPILW